MLGKIENRLFKKMSFMALGIAAASLGGCGGDNNKIIVEPPCDTPSGCYMVKGVDNRWVYKTLDACYIAPENAAFISSKACASEGAEVDLCDQINGRTYYSTTLEEGGETPSGVAKMHWRIGFANGQLNMLQSDFGMTGTYSCKAGKLVAIINSGKPVERTIEFSADRDQFKFNTLGTGEITYQYSSFKADVTSCNAVRGQGYTTSAGTVKIAIDTPTVLDFATTPNTVTYSHGNSEESGYYDCDLGELHVHLNANNSDPLHLSVVATGEAVTIAGKPPITLNRLVKPEFCTQEYKPVCASFDTGLRCVTTPCPSLVYRTYSNGCMASLAHSSVLFDGSCGNLEALPVGGSTEKACTADVMPVCAKVPKNIQCITSPCESHEYRTFGNACSASLQYGVTSFDGVCETIGIDGQLCFAQEPARLYNFDGGGSRGIQPMPKGSSVTVTEAVIAGNVLTVTLGYSGCKIQPVHFNVDASGLSKSSPPQLVYNFNKDVEDVCQAAFQSTYEFDLLPVSKRFSGEGRNGIAINFGKISLLYKF